jgi:hypothetical protein
MSGHKLSEAAQMSRAALHLINFHGRRAAAVAEKRAAYLHECGEDLGADTWRKISEFVRVIEAREAQRAVKPANPQSTLHATPACDHPTAPSADDSHVGHDNCA